VDLTEAIRVLMGHADRAEVVTELQKAAHPIYQEIFNRGHAEETRNSKSKLEDKDAKIAALTTERDAAMEKAKSFDKTAPEWETKEKQYQSEIASLKEKAATAQQEAQATVLAERRNTALSDLKARLIARKIHPDYADVLIQKPDVVKRVVFDEKDGSRRVLQAGKEIPLSPAEGQDVLDMMADELVSKTDKLFITANGDRGSNLTGQPAETGTFLAQHKAKLEEQRKKEAASASGTKTLDERLGRA
jgi:uncharacterized protein YdaU (DUF1376 family)